MGDGMRPWAADEDAALMRERDALAEKVERFEALVREWAEIPPHGWCPICHARRPPHKQACIMARLVALTEGET